MSVFPSVTALKDGNSEKVEASTFNLPLNQLRERTDYLKNELDKLVGSGPFESVRLSAVRLDPNNLPARNTVVCVEPSTRYFVPAVSAILTSPVYPYSLATPGSYAVGLLTSVAGNTGAVVLYGKVDLSTVVLTDLLDSGEVFRDGPYYLSTSTAGRLTANPKGMAILIGYFYGSQLNPGYGDFAALAPQLKDLYEAHLHKDFVLFDRPSGSMELVSPITGLPATDTEMENLWKVRGFKPDVYNTPWTAEASVVFGASTVPTAGNGHWYKCVSAGTTVTGTSEPTWPTNGTPEAPVTVTDGSATWLDMGLHTMLNIRGSLDGSGDTYTFTLVTSQGSGLIRDARLYWSTAAGSEPAGSVALKFYENDVEIGTQGLQVHLECAGTVASWQSKDFNTVPAGISADQSTTWTLELPAKAQGWHAHKVQKFGVYTGVSTAPDYSLQVFGTYVSPNNSAGENIRLAVSNSGDLLTAGSGPDIDVYDINDNLICGFTDVTFSKGALHVVDSGLYDLYLIINKTSLEGLEAEDSLMTADDAWEFEFSDEAVNSKFEYAIGFDPVLNAYYPPQPLLDVVLEVNGVNLDARDKFNLGLGSYKATYKTLYWYQDDYAEAPFPSDWVSTDVVGDESCQKNMLLYSATMRAASAGIVTSIVPKPGSSVRITDKRTGLPAAVGDLEVDATFNIDISDTATPGFMVLKDVDSKGKVLRGPVVEEIRAGAGITLSSTSGGAKHQGIVTVGSNVAGMTYGDFSDIFYLNAKSEVIPGRLFSYIKLMPWTTMENGALKTNNVPSAFVAKFRVPYSLPGTYRVLVHATMFGLESIAEGSLEAGKKYAGLRFTYSVGQDYSLGSSTPVLVQRNFATVDSNTGVLERVIENIDVAVGCAGTGGATNGYTAYDPFLFHNDLSLEPIDGQILQPFMAPLPQSGTDTPASVTAGNIVAVKFERCANYAYRNLDYTAALGFISLKWKLIPAT